MKSRVLVGTEEFIQEEKHAQAADCIRDSGDTHS